MEDPGHVDPDLTWLDPLRMRLLEIARRRVPEDVADDLVQDAIGIVLERGVPLAIEQGLPRPSLKWCFMTLRNVIGNWYQKRRDHLQLEDVRLVDPSPGPLAALTREERRRRVREALEALRRQSHECATWLWAVANGTRPATVATEAGIEAGAFYRRLYRCRKKLQALLLEKGLHP
jgi:RNA polymerase sigma factor (sigma-70 family)